MRAPRGLFLVRHGLPDYCGRKPGDLWPGPPLSEIGRDQAAQAAEVLAAHGALRVYTSPLSRTRETAEVVARRCGGEVEIASDLREWHRTERLHEMSLRLTRWLVHWLRGNDERAVVVSHASPLLAILRAALYLPQVSWHQPGRPDVLELSSVDRFEVSMASVYELRFEAGWVEARQLFHPRPRVQHAGVGRRQERLPHPMGASPEAPAVRRPDRLALIGYRGGAK